MTDVIRLRNPWDERLARAAVLAKEHPVAAELLNFYRATASFQKSFEEYLSASGYPALKASRLAEELDLFLLLPRFDAFLRIVRNSAPRELAEAARCFEAQGPGRWSTVIGEYWRRGESADFTPGERFLARAFLQPVAEHLASSADFDAGHNYARPICPFCTRRPAAGALRQEGDGGKRSLICSLCATEWQFRRILCPGCGETNLEKLPVYVAEDFDYVRVEGCDTCKTFIKTIDLTINGRADPLVDELATVSLTLWAQEKGYAKLEPNLLGM